MDRTTFIEKIHNINHDTENNYSELFPKESIISVELSDDSEYLKESIEELKNKINIQLNKICESEIDYPTLLNFISENNCIFQKYYGDNILAVNYNDLYDSVKNDFNNESILIYRVENDNGRGLYRSMSDNEFDISDYFEFCRERQPSPMEDSTLQSVFHNEYLSNDRKREWIFGFNSEEGIKNWCSNISNCGEYDLFDFVSKNSPDMNVSVYEVNKSDIIQTNTQVIFKKSLATKISSYKFKDLQNKETLEVENFLSDKNVDNVPKNNKRKRLSVS